MPFDLPVKEVGGALILLNLQSIEHLHQRHRGLATSPRATLGSAPDAMMSKAMIRRQVMCSSFAMDKRGPWLRGAVGYSLSGLWNSRLTVSPLRFEGLVVFWGRWLIGPMVNSSRVPTRIFLVPVLFFFAPPTRSIPVVSNAS